MMISAFKMRIMLARVVTPSESLSSEQIGRAAKNNNALTEMVTRSSSLSGLRINGRFMRKDYTLTVNASNF
ncbi:hypothetical protein NBRC116583_16960 [Arenicella sp. 4NH20-0111]